MKVKSHQSERFSHKDLTENRVLIELDDGNIYRKALYLMVKTMVSGLDFPLNQSIEVHHGTPKSTG